MWSNLDSCEEIETHVESYDNKPFALKVGEVEVGLLFVYNSPTQSLNKPEYIRMQMCRRVTRAHTYVRPLHPVARFYVSS